MISDNMGNVADYGGETVYRGPRSRFDFQKGVPGRADRAVRECEGCGSIYTKNRRND